MAEIVIATTGRETNSQDQWNVHGAAAERAGAGRAVLDVIRSDGSLSGLNRNAVAIAFTRQCFREGTVRPETVEIAALIGDDLMIAVALEPSDRPRCPS